MTLGPLAFLTTAAKHNIKPRPVGCRARTEASTLPGAVRQSETPSLQWRDGSGAAVLTRPPSECGGRRARSQKMNVKRRQAAAFKDKDLSHRGRVRAGKHPLTLGTRRGGGGLLSAAADTA